MSRLLLMIGARIVPGALAIGLAAASLSAHAGRDCMTTQLPAQDVVRSMALAQRTAAALNASGARMVLLARSGQSLETYGLQWSHFGLAYKTAEGPWRVMHKLNDCGSAHSGVWRQGLGEFFMDGLWRYESAWVVPTEDVQQRLLTYLSSTDRATLLDEPAYSMVAYAWGQRYQQSNQWALETFAAAMEPSIVRNREQAQAWLKFRGYTPSVLQIRPLTRLGGRITRANIAFDDHPSGDRYSDRIATVTVDSVFAWMTANGLGTTASTLAR